MLKQKQFTVYTRIKDEEILTKFENRKRGVNLYMKKGKNAFFFQAISDCASLLSNRIWDVANIDVKGNNA